LQLIIQIKSNRQYIRFVLIKIIKILILLYRAFLLLRIFQCLDIFHAGGKFKCEKVQLQLPVNSNCHLQFIRTCLLQYNTLLYILYRVCHRFRLTKRDRAVTRLWRERRLPRAPVYRERKNWDFYNFYAYDPVLTRVYLI